MSATGNVRIPLQERPVFPAGSSTFKCLLSGQADAKYSTPEHVITDLNNLFQTSLAVDYPPLRSFVDSFISQGLDFGAIFARLRCSWPASYEIATRSNQLEDDFLDQVSNIESYGDTTRTDRDSSIKGQTIHQPHRIRPRRLWDLPANRVIPYHYFLQQGGYLAPLYWAISHSWTDDMIKLDTPINGCEWPVPIPPGVTLEAVRNELLNMDVEYAWLDVLCLRQSCLDPGKEEIRKKEWAVDVPTIGSVYVQGAFRVLQYMNGLGRAFEVSGWDSPRHWLNRAWTLQEAKLDSIIGGVPQGMKDPLDERSVETGELLRDRISLISEVETQESNVYSARDFPNIINAMRRRFSTNPVDKIAGIVMLFRSKTLPLYDEAKCEEEAWAPCVSHLPPHLRTDLLFGFHTPG